MSEQEAIEYMERLRREREQESRTPEQAMDRLVAAGIIDNNGEITEYYKSVFS